MGEGLTYKERYNYLVNKISQTIESKEGSVKLANKVLNDSNLVGNSFELRDNIVKAINENEVVINEMHKLLEFTSCN